MPVALSCTKEEEIIKNVGDCLNMHKEGEEKSAQNFGGKPNNGAGCGAKQGGGKVQEGCA